MLPGGGREETEDAATCVVREVREETGLAVRIEQLLIDCPAPPAEKSYARWRTYLCSVVDGEAAPGGGEGDDADLIAIRWLPINDESQWPVEIQTDPLLTPQLHAIQTSLRVPPPVGITQLKEPSPFFDQSPYSVRFEWGESGLDAIVHDDSLIVIVDVLSFSTSVEIATARGAEVFPFRWRDETAARFANERQAILAEAHRGTARYSLSPASLVNIQSGTRLVLPSPNGATLSLKASRLGPAVTACLRNAAAVSAFVRSHGGPVAIIGCGERWADGSLRPAWEDLIGAGAVIAELSGTRSPRLRRLARHSAAPGWICPAARKVYVRSGAH